LSYRGKHAPSWRTEQTISLKNRLGKSRTLATQTRKRSGLSGGLEAGRPAQSPAGSRPPPGRTQAATKRAAPALHVPARKPSGRNYFRHRPRLWLSLGENRVCAKKVYS